MVHNLFTISKVAETLGVSKSHVFGLVDTGSLLAVDISTGKKRRNLRIRESDLTRFLESREIQAKPTYTPGSKRQSYAYDIV